MALKAESLFGMNAISLVINYYVDKIILLIVLVLMFDLELC